MRFRKWFSKIGRLEGHPGNSYSYPKLIHGALKLLLSVHFRLINTKKWFSILFSCQVIIFRELCNQWQGINFLVNFRFRSPHSSPLSGYQQRTLATGLIETTLDDSRDHPIMLSWRDKDPPANPTEGINAEASHTAKLLHGLVLPQMRLVPQPPNSYMPCYKIWPDPLPSWLITRGSTRPASTH